MIIRLTTLLKELFEEETPEQPVKRKRGRPSNAERAARAAAELAAKQKKGQESLPQGVKSDIAAAKARRAQRDAETMGQAKKEFDAAVAKEKTVKVKTKKGTVRAAALPSVDDTPTRSTGRASREDDNDTEYDIDKARQNRGTI